MWLMSYYALSRRTPRNGVAIHALTRLLITYPYRSHRPQAGDKRCPIICIMLN
ncbi:hypothetical protein PMW_59 [Pseudomonas phage phiPMW]|uniref:Uncharacterized protein n=1 Tax=Pseudomonas phage phiPMW TaxID=1815582 RepID=A0A1S5R198_9CAUD|nr:hypothetical protein FDG97_gp059 [Pseudomonas phage phiPMW]ANA49184.1 hypothetical protein PMW_59 [Pseudomonas phage phiPMW]